MKKTAFTLVEILVALFILSIILVMGAAAINLTVGKMRSKKTADIVQPVRNAFDIISQKMNTANEKLPSASPTVYGFNVSSSAPNQILEIVNKASTTSCTYIGLNTTDHKLYMNQIDSCTSINPSIAGQAITPATINVTAFTVSNLSTNSYFMTNDHPDKIPYTTIEITAQDPIDPTNTVTVRTSYFLDYQTVNNLK